MAVIMRLYDQARNQKGNVLWFILITIALFGALAAVISRNSSSVNQSGNIEKARIAAAALLRHSKSVENTVQKMILNGVSESDLDFVAISANHDNPNCSAAECEVFNVAGGGIAYKSPAKIINNSSYSGNWLVSSQNLVYQQGCDALSSSCTELLLLAADIPKSVCLQVNAILKTTNPNSDAPQQQEILDDEEFAGVYSSTINSQFIGGTNATNESPELNGKSAGCLFEFGSAQNKYYFYQVLLSR